MTTLVIVESPTKAKALRHAQRLGRDYVVRASMGHVRDLPAKELGVALEAGFKPTCRPQADRREFFRKRIVELC